MVGLLKLIREYRRQLLLLVVVYVIFLKVLHSRYWSSAFRPQAQRFISQWWNGPQNGSGITVSEYDEDANGNYERQLELGSIWEKAAFQHANGTMIIAIGSAITSRGVSTFVNVSNMADAFQFFRILVPTFCRTATASDAFHYRFYLAHDADDPIFSDRQFRTAFRQTFKHRIAVLCDSVHPTLRFVRCPHSSKPAWAQNDAMIDAYLDGAEYFYRINDDTQMLSAGWTPAFIGVLLSYSPPHIGVVGPNHYGGNVEILTYDFVHRTHVDLFGFYYPRVFADWWGDEWITRVYRPGRSTKLHRIRLAHTLGLGRRYNVTWSTSKLLNGQLARDMKAVRRYVTAVRNNNETGSIPHGRHIISMSLYGTAARYRWGAIRNAQLVRVFLPTWRLRVYISDSDFRPEMDMSTRIVRCLLRLGAEVVRIDPAKVKVEPRNWRLLAIEDVSIDFVLIRDADWRLTEREVSAIREWISAADHGGSDTDALHCMRDHPDHVKSDLVDGLWGGRPEILRRQLGITSGILPGRQILPDNGTVDYKRVNQSQSQSNSRWLDTVWSALSKSAFCHDSVSPCDRFPYGNRRSFPVLRRPKEYVGQKYDEHEVPLSNDWQRLKNDVTCLSSLPSSSFSKISVP